MKPFYLFLTTLLRNNWYTIQLFTIQWTNMFINFKLVKPWLQLSSEYIHHHQKFPHPLYAFLSPFPSDSRWSALCHYRLLAFSGILCKFTHILYVLFVLSGFLLFSLIALILVHIVLCFNSSLPPIAELIPFYGYITIFSIFTWY